MCAVEVSRDFLYVNTKPFLPDCHKRDELPLFSFDLVDLAEDIFHDRTESCVHVIVKFKIIKVAEKKQKRPGDES